MIRPKPTLDVKITVGNFYAGRDDKVIAEVEAGSVSGFITWHRFLEAEDLPFFYSFTGKSGKKSHSASPGASGEVGTLEECLKAAELKLVRSTRAAERRALQRYEEAKRNTEIAENPTLFNEIRSKLSKEWGVKKK